METYAILHITIVQIVFCTIACIAIFARKYNSISDELEEKENHTYKFGKFLKNNIGNFIYYILSGFVLLGVANELGLEFLVKNIADIDFSSNGEKAVDITIAVLSAFIGHKIVKKFV